MRNSLILSALLVLFVGMSTTACGGKNRHHDGNTRVQSQIVGSELVLLNNSAEAVFTIQMSPSADPSFGPDLLGDDVLMVGSSFRISGIGAGYWDIRVQDSSGNKKEFFRQQVDGSGSYHLVIDSYGWTR